MIFINIALAQASYVPLAPLPGIAAGQAVPPLSQYLNIVFSLGISVAAGLAVLMIVIGGIQYMSTDAVGGKEDAKGRITSALWGLLLALCSYLILYTINPDLLNTSLTSMGTIGASGIIPLTPVAGSPDQYGYVGDTSGSSAAFQNAAQNFSSTNYNGQTITANNIALDTDGTGLPGFSEGGTHQAVTSYTSGGQSLNAMTDDYVAVPTSAGIPPGTPILITDNTTGQTLQAIAGDNGATGWGEMSVHAAQTLGLWSPGMGNSINQSHNITYTVGTQQ